MVQQEEDETSNEAGKSEKRVVIAVEGGREGRKEGRKKEGMKKKDGESVFQPFAHISFTLKCITVPVREGRN